MKRISDYVNVFQGNGKIDLPTPEGIAATWLFGLFVKDAMMLGVMMLMFGMPVGSMTAMLAQEYGGDYELASQGVTITTLLAVVTMPVVSMLMGI